MSTLKMGGERERERERERRGKGITKKRMKDSWVGFLRKRGCRSDRWIR